MIFVDSLKHCYYPTLAGIMVDYKEQVFISGIKEISNALFVMSFRKNQRT